MSSSKAGMPSRFRLMGPLLFAVFNANSLWGLALLVQEREFVGGERVLSPTERVAFWILAFGIFDLSHLPGVAPFTRAMMQIAALFTAVFAIIAEYSDALADSARTSALALTVICTQVLSLIALGAEIRRRRRPPNARAEKNPQKPG